MMAATSSRPTVRIPMTTTTEAKTLINKLIHCTRIPCTWARSGSSDTANIFRPSKSSTSTTVTAATRSATKSPDATVANDPKRY